MTRAPIDPIGALLEIGEEDAEALRSAALRDPPRGCPLVLRDRRGDELESIEPGGWRDHPLTDALTGLPPGCPVTPLGSDGETFYFLNTLGQVHLLKGTIGKTQLDALFQGRGGYLDWAWPKWKAGKVLIVDSANPGAKPKMKSAPQVSGYEGDEVRRDLFAACAFKGTFALEDRVRGRGAWRDLDGSLVYHAGDAVYVDGRWVAPGEVGRFIYPSRPKLDRPNPKYEKEGPGSPGDTLLETLKTFNWERAELDPRLALGWLMTAKIGGALERRPVVFIVGEEGSGKSTFQELMRLAMNKALLATSNTTQAGIYQRVGQDSVAIMVDEMEAKEDTRTTDKIIELARIAYSGDKMQRGGKDGDAKEFSLRSSFMGSSIAKPATGAQDDSRMAVLMMRPIKDAKADKPFEAKDLEAWGSQLLRRAFHWYPDWDRLLRAFRAALIAVGHDSRAADTFGALAAGYHMAVRDDMPTEGELAEWQGLLAPMDLAETAEKKKTWRRCFDVIMDMAPDTWRSEGGPKTIGGQLEQVKNDPGTQDAAVKKLAPFGITLSWPDGDRQMAWQGARLFIPASHPGMHDLLQATPWAGRMGDTGPWIGVLRQMPQALFENGKCDRGLDKKRSGIFIKLAQVWE